MIVHHKVAHQSGIDNFTAMKKCLCTLMAMVLSLGLISTGVGAAGGVHPQSCCGAAAPESLQQRAGRGTTVCCCPTMEPCCDLVPLVALPHPECVLIRPENSRAAGVPSLAVVFGLGPLSSGDVVLKILRDRWPPTSLDTPIFLLKRCLVI